MDSTADLELNRLFRRLFFSNLNLWLEKGAPDDDRFD